jgi:hypothetical protein
LHIIQPQMLSNHGGREKKEREKKKRRKKLKQKKQELLYRLINNDEFIGLNLEEKKRQ